MKKLTIAFLTFCAVYVLADAPTPFPLTVNSESDNVPALTVYEANARTFRVTFKDGTNGSVITGYTPFFSWATNATASSVVTASYSVVSAEVGIVDFTFSSSDLNYSGGRYIYETGVKDGSDIPTVYRQGTFIIKDSPFSSGADPVTWTTNINWGLYRYLYTGTAGPIRPDNSTIVASTNADGSLTISATGTNAVSWDAILNKPTLVTNAVVTGGYLTESGTAQKSIGLTRAAIVSAISGQILDAGSFTNLNETDPAWAAVSNTVTAGAAAGATALQPGASGTSTNLADYNNDAGFLTAETDPVWISQSNLIQEMAENGQTAYGWGDHGTNGYLTAETDPVWAAVSNTVRSQAENGQTAYGWGDHGTNGYLTAETDPVWAAVSNTVRSQAENGQTAYGWGDHALQGYKDFAQGTNIVPLVSLSGITSNQIDSTTDAAYRTGGGGGGSGFPLTNDVDLAGYSMTNGNDITVTNSFSGKSLTVTETITVNKAGGGIVQGKSGTGNSLILKQDDGELNMIELGRNTVVGVGVAQTGVVIVAHGGLAPVNVIASSFGVHDGATTNFTVTGAGVLNTKSYKWNGTNVYQARNGSIGGTNSLFWTVNGTNYHMRLE